ncbi:MAG: MFS transporter [Xanthomonadales bacterium]|nr:MFS transporter [Gammaproteobacteria bacterium]NNE04296.1 MFS transporter [Xanthomonadales bacterium]NNL95974.1 MFS transporter [Xanthomonadales bacterium]
MIRAITPVSALLLGVAILLAGQGLQGILLPVRANLEGFSAIAVGSIGTFYFLGFTFGCWKGTALIRNVGHVRVFAAMTALASASPLLQGLWVNLWSWGMLRFLTGFCFAVLYIVIESWLNEQSDNSNRATVFSAYILINMTVLAIGQQMLLLGDPMNLQLFALTSVLVSLAAVPVALSTAEAPRKVKDSRLDFRESFNTSPAGMLGSLAAGMANGAFWALGPVFVASLSDELTMAAWFMTAGVLGGATGQFPLGRISDRTDRRNVLLGISIVGAIIGLCLWLFSGELSKGAILSLGFGFGMMAYPVYSISVAHANDRANPEAYVRLSSALLLMYGIGAITGPLLASLIMSVSGSGGLFAYSALVHVMLAGYLLFARQRRRSTVQHQREFSDSLTSALTSSQVYEDETSDAQPPKE